MVSTIIGVSVSGCSVVPDGSEVCCFEVVVVTTVVTSSSDGWVTPSVGVLVTISFVVSTFVVVKETVLLGMVVSIIFWTHSKLFKANFFYAPLLNVFNVHMNYFLCEEYLILTPINFIKSNIT